MCSPRVDCAILRADGLAVYTHMIGYQWEENTDPVDSEGNQDREPCKAMAQPSFTQGEIDLPRSLASGGSHPSCDSAWVGAERSERPQSIDTNELFTLGCRTQAG